MNNYLGPYQFVRWDRAGERGAPPDTVHEQIELIQRPGVNDTGFLFFGKKGQPFQMVSGLDLASVGVALDLFAAYTATVGNVAEIIWHSQNISQLYTLEYFIQDVKLQQIKTLAAAAGGLNGGNVWLEALWTLVPTRPR